MFICLSEEHVVHRCVTKVVSDGPAVSGESPPGLPKDLISSLSTDISFDMDSPFPLDELKIDPLTLDGLHMLNDPDMILTDPATEDAFRLDRL